MTEDMKKAIQEECAFEDLIWYNLQEINAISTKNLNKVESFGSKLSLAFANFPSKFPPQKLF